MSSTISTTPTTPTSSTTSTISTSSTTPTTSTTSTTSTPPAINFQPKPFILPASAGNPMLSAFKQTQGNAVAQNNLVTKVGGKKRSKKINKIKKIINGGADIVIPNVSSPVSPLVATTSPQSNATKLTQLYVNNINNSSNDGKLSVPTNTTNNMKGGYLTKWNWGCMSGGKNTYKNRANHKNIKKGKHKLVKTVRFLLEKNTKRAKHKNTKRSKHKNKKNTYKKRKNLKK
jgi:hypothetical protein